MSNLKIENREEILSRLMKSSLKLWGLKNKDIDSFDPVVKLLLSGFAQEIHKVYHEIENANVRSLKQLSNLITPGYNSNVSPAHGLLSVSPLEPITLLRKYFQFYVSKEQARKLEQEVETQEVRVFFSPLDYYKIYDAKVSSIITKDSIKFFDDVMDVEHSENNQTVQNINDNELVIGLSINKKITNIDSINLNFDWKNIPNKFDLFYLLKDSKCTLNGENLPFSIGIKNEANTQDFELNIPSYQKERLRTNHTELEVSEIYKNRFLSLDFTNIDVDHLDYFKEPQGLNPDEHIDTNKYKTLWLKFELNTQFSASINEHIIIRTNTFPVINRRYEELSIDILNAAHIVPLITHQADFFDLISVTDEDKNHFISQNSVSKIKDLEERSYSLRESGIERFDTRDSQELLNHLIDLLRDESAVFSAIGSDFLSSILKELNQTINRLEDKLKDQVDQIRNQTHYLIVKAPPECRTLYVDYWSSNGTFANGIGPNDQVYTDFNSDYDDGLTQFVGMVDGGKDKKIGDELLSGLRRSIITENKIISKMDIMLFLKDEYQSILRNVDVKNGGMISKLKGEGYIPTLDIHFRLKKFDEENDALDYEILKNEIRTKLELKSPHHYNYQIFISE